jgi:predicted alpha/beta hydrolase family esterase
MKLGGIILVSPCYTDLGDLNERASGYYNRPWNWEKIRANCSFVAQFSSPSDPLVPFAEQTFVRDHLQPEFHELPKRGHFCSHTFPELLEFITQKLKS